MYGLLWGFGMVFSPWLAMSDVDLPFCPKNLPGSWQVLCKPLLLVALLWFLSFPRSWLQSVALAARAGVRCQLRALAGLGPRGWCRSCRGTRLASLEAGGCLAQEKHRLYLSLIKCHAGVQMVLFC